MKAPKAPVLITSIVLAGLASVSLAVQTPGMDRVREFITEGAIKLDLRPRYEMVNEDGAETSHAITMRTGLGYVTKAWRGFQAMVGFENIASPYPDGYNASQLNSDARDKAVVTDPTGTNVSDAWLRYTLNGSSITLGRQSLTLDNGRFIGDHSWRQNFQTMDALVVRDRSIKDLAVTYAYIGRVNRVYGPDHPQGVYHSNSHVVHAAYDRFSAGTISAYGYLLDFDGVAAGNSCATYGMSFVGEHPIYEQFTIGYHAEYALQTDYGSSPLYFSANYIAFAADVGTEDLRVGLGHEMLGTDNNFGFRTPLASLHQFNGWSDQFLNTPSQGLRDTYFRAEGNLPWYGLGFAGASHKFTSDSGEEFGSEINLEASCLLTESVTATVKYASFKSSHSAFEDTTKLWAQMRLMF